MTLLFRSFIKRASSWDAVQLVYQYPLHIQSYPYISIENGPTVIGWLFRVILNKHHNHMINIMVLLLFNVEIHRLHIKFLRIYIPPPSESQLRIDRMVQNESNLLFFLVIHARLVEELKNLEIKNISHEKGKWLWSLSQRIKNFQTSIEFRTFRQMDLRV